jgi:hypothetical protein
MIYVNRDQMKCYQRLVYYGKKQCCGSESVFRVRRYLYGSGSFHHKANILREALIFTILRLLYDFLSLKNYVNVPSKVGSLKKNLDNKYFLLAS